MEALPRVSQQQVDCEGATFIHLLSQLEGHPLRRAMHCCGQGGRRSAPGIQGAIGQQDTGAHADRHSPSQCLQRRGSQGGALGGEGDGVGHTQVLSTLLSGRCGLETSREVCSVQPARWAGQGRGRGRGSGQGQGRGPTLQVEKSLSDEATCLQPCGEDAQSLVLSHAHSRLPEQEGQCCTRVGLDVGALSVHAEFGLVHLCDCFFTG